MLFADVVYLLFFRELFRRCCCHYFDATMLLPTATPLLIIITYAFRFDRHYAILPDFHYVSPPLR